MPIALLEICEWRGTRRTDRVVRNPTLVDVHEAVQSLDGGARNDLYLRVRSDAPTPWLCIGGGTGRYVVTGAEDDESRPWRRGKRRAPPDTFTTVMRMCRSIDGR